MRAGDPAAAISRAALNGSQILSRKRHWICGLLFTVRRPANLALKVMSTGGIFLAGGISPKILAETERPGLHAGVPRERADGRPG